MSREAYLIQTKKQMQKDFNDAINFAIDQDLMAASFLELWRAGEWDAIDIEFPEFDTTHVRLP